MGFYLNKKSFQELVFALKYISFIYLVIQVNLKMTVNATELLEKISKENEEKLKSIHVDKAIDLILMSDRCWLLITTY